MLRIFSWLKQLLIRRAAFRNAVLSNLKLPSRKGDPSTGR